ncbi:MAG: hypothetical protein ABI921_12550, partial [Panacibacter sp.]
EILCYAITDLSYRSGYKIPDLLHGYNDPAADIIGQFHTAKKIFPNTALTINDYRRLIIDLTGIKNAWLRKKIRNVVADLTNKTLTHEAVQGSGTKQVAIKGYYDVLLEFDTTIKDETVQNEKITEVRSLLQANRNLDEDFEQVSKVPQQAYRLCSEIDIQPNANAVDVLGEIFFRIQLHLSPLVKFYSLQQMLEDKNEKYTTDTIFEGPFFSHGFIKEKELVSSELKSCIRLSDLMQVILSTEGVINIADIIFNAADQVDELPNKWIVDVQYGFQPVVDILKSNIVVYKNGVPVRLNRNDIKIKYDALMDAFLNANETVASSDIVFDTGKSLAVNDYYSVQNHFPKNYGISHWGLPDNITTERKKQAKQLQAYLWMFDQVLANYLAQLASVKNLFSLDDAKHTYFTQLVKSFKDAEELFFDAAQAEKNLQSQAETKEVFLQRRNVFLDHLLSRFAESFYDYMGILHQLFPYTEPEKIIAAKTTFLKNYPEYSCQRALAYNYSKSTEIWNSSNISGFEKRVQRLLGFDNINRRTLVNMLSVIREEEIAGVKKFWFEIIDNRTSAVLLTASEKFDDQQSAEEELAIARTLTFNKDNFKIIKDNDSGKFFYELRDKLNNLIAAGQQGTKKNAENDLQQLFALLANMTEEGMFLVEHLLLYSATTNHFMPICVDENCDECSDTDPYSFRISIVMPAYAPRFLNMDFRDYVEKVMREEMPSHLLPKICWVTNEQLHDFEEIYQQWLQVKAGALPDEDGAILEKMIKVFTSLKTVYPEGFLMECSDKEQQQLFMLDKNSLGTLRTGA